MSGVTVKTDGGGYFASLEHERVLIEFSKDGDSPNCPWSWTWDMWFDGEHIDGTIDEASLSATVEGAILSIDAVIRELSKMREYLVAYGAFGKKTEVDE